VSVFFFGVLLYVLLVVLCARSDSWLMLVVSRTVFPVFPLVNFIRFYFLIGEVQSQILYILRFKY